MGIAVHVASVLGTYGFSSPTYFPSPGDVTLGNDAMLALCDAEPQRVRMYATVNPNHTAHALAEIERCVARGAIGIKLLASRRADDPLLDPIAELAAEHQLPILHHAWQHRRHDWPSQEASDAVELGRLAADGDEAFAVTPDGAVRKSRYDKFRQVNRFLELVDDVVPALPAEGRLRIVDFGCGSGANTALLANRGAHVWAVDISEDLIRLAERRMRVSGRDERERVRVRGPEVTGEVDDADDPPRLRVVDGRPLICPRDPRRSYQQAERASTRSPASSVSVCSRIVLPTC